VLKAFRLHTGGQKAEGKRQKWEVDAHKAKGKSRKWVLKAFRLHTGGRKAKGKSRKWVLKAFRHHGGGHLLPFFLLPFAFEGVASVRNPKSKIENPKSCVGPSGILTGSRTRPSDWGSNARFRPVEDRRNNRGLATSTCTLCVLRFGCCHLSTFGCCHLSTLSLPPRDWGKNDMQHCES